MTPSEKLDREWKLVVLRLLLICAWHFVARSKGFTPSRQVVEDQAGALSKCQDFYAKTMNPQTQEEEDGNVEAATPKA